MGYGVKRTSAKTCGSGVGEGSVRVCVYRGADVRCLVRLLHASIRFFGSLVPPAVGGESGCARLHGLRGAICCGPSTAYILCYSLPVRIECVAVLSFGRRGSLLWLRTCVLWHFGSDTANKLVLSAGAHTPFVERGAQPACVARLFYRNRPTVASGKPKRTYVPVRDVGQGDEVAWP